MTRKTNGPPTVIFVCALVTALILLASIYSNMNKFVSLFDKPLCKNCNIVLISLDTLSANHLPCYGYTRDTAPNLCAFAKDNILFQNSFSNATWTLPSHVSILTGQFPSTHGVNIAYKDALKKSTPFLPDILKQNGYETLFVMPLNDPHLPIDKVYGRGIDKIVEAYGLSWKEALGMLQDNVTKGKKTFLFLHTYTVHSPYLTQDRPKLYTKDTFENIPTRDEEYFKITSGLLKYIVASTSADLKTDKFSSSDRQKIYDVLSKITSPAPDYDNIKQALTENGYFFGYINEYNYQSKINIHDVKQVEYLKALYDQNIHELDEQQIKDFLNFISQDTVKNNTIVIITSDHGEEFMEHKKTGHLTLYDSNIKTPLVFYVPGIIKKLIDKGVQSVDILPTVLDLVGIKNNGNFIQGISLTSDMRREGQSDRLLVTDGYGLQKITLRQNNWKLFLNIIDNQLVPYELYNIAKDPNEKENVLFSNTDVVNQIMKKYSDIDNRAGDSTIKRQ